MPAVCWATFDGKSIKISGDKECSVLADMGTLCKGDKVYFDDSVREIAAELVRGFDGKAYGSPSRIVAMELAGVSWLHYSCWGVDNLDQLQRLAMLCVEHGIKWKSSASATVAGLLPAGGCTLPQWREASHAAVHSGPIHHARGGCDFGYHVDRTGAYLQSMRCPLPDSRSWYLVHSDDYQRVFERTDYSIVCAVVEVAHTTDTNQLPPLPVRTANGRVLYPVGIIRGVWPALLLRGAVDRGEVTVCSIEWMISARRTTDEYSRMADRIDSLPKELRKVLYTRAWGKMASRGSSVGAATMPNSGAVPVGGLFWSDNARPSWRPRAPQWYRPDVAAFIVGINHEEMVRAVRRTKPETLVAVHVDAIWTADATAGDWVGNGWKLEGKGRVRFIAPGRYAVHDDNGTYYGHSGTGPVSSEEELSEALPAGVFQSRGWLEDPRKEAGARSVAPSLHTLEGKLVGGFAPNDLTFWNGRGYPRDKVLEGLQS